MHHLFGAIEMRLASLVCALLITPFLRGQEISADAKKIIFLGDSITYSGQYVALFETEWLLENPKREVEVLNLGLPSETVSGLSEEGHAGGTFPRPTLHERLDRVLEKAKPDLVFACYGMNDGIYLPLAAERFDKYKDGLRLLRQKVTKAGAKIIHLTPPVFDPLPIRARLAPADKVDANHPYEKYDTVLDAYAAWLVEQRKEGWAVIDVHAWMKDSLAEARHRDAMFTFAKDGVHPNFEGQVVIAHALLSGLKMHAAPSAEWSDPKSRRGRLYKLVEKRQQVLRDAWLTHIGHLRPMAKGLPLEEAKTKAAELTRQIREFIK
jgi:lysophospholipase L1-like esterase